MTPIKALLLLLRVHRLATISFIYICDYDDDDYVGKNVDESELNHLMSHSIISDDVRALKKSIIKI